MSENTETTAEQANLLERKIQNVLAFALFCATRVGHSEAEQKLASLAQGEPVTVGEEDLHETLAAFLDDMNPAHSTAAEEYRAHAKVRRYYKDKAQALIKAMDHLAGISLKAKPKLLDAYIDTLVTIPAKVAFTV